MKMIPIVITATMILSAGSNIAKAAAPEKTSEDLQRARQYLSMDELAMAKRLTQEVMNRESENKGASDLMAEIINREVSEQKQIENQNGQTKALEEYTSQETKDAVKTWIERSKLLMSVQQYDQAINAAEKVFTYDPNNLDASQLIDQIKKQAAENGKSDELILKKMYQGEIDTRVEDYLRQTNDFIRRQKWGAAKLTVEKILLLDPENKKALNLYDIVKKNMEQKG